MATRQLSVCKVVFKNEAFHLDDAQVAAPGRILPKESAKRHVEGSQPHSAHPQVRWLPSVLTSLA